MTQKHFDAILAKNNIAKQLRDAEGTGTLGEVKIDRARLLFYLREIETYVGEGNQPSIMEIL